MKTADSGKHIWRSSLILGGVTLAWGGLLWGLGALIYRLWPALAAGDPAAALVTLPSLLAALYLIQAPVYRPAVSSEPWFLITSRCPEFLWRPSRPKCQPGPALAALASPEELTALLAEAEFRPSLTGSLSRLLDDRDPLAVLIQKAVESGWPILGPLGRLLRQLLGPARHLGRLAGYICLLAERKAAAGPSALRVDLAARSWALWRRAETFNREQAALGRDTAPPEELCRLLAQGDRAARGQTEPVAASAETWAADLARLLAEPALRPRYQGIYWDAPAELEARSVSEMCREDPAAQPADFHPPELAAFGGQYAFLTAQSQRLSRALARGAAGGLRRFDGRGLYTWEAEKTRYESDLDRRKVLAVISAHHRRCRGFHLALARRAGIETAYLDILGRLRYAEQSRAALAEDEAEWIDTGKQALESARRLHGRLADLYRTGCADLIEPWPELALLPPSRKNLAAWREVCGDWREIALIMLDRGRRRALAELIVFEESLEEGRPPAETALLPVEAADLPIFYWRSRPPAKVHSAAEGLSLGFGRSFLTLLLLALLFWQGSGLGASRLFIYNGLPVRLTVELNGEQVPVKPLGRAEARIRPDRLYLVRALAGEEVIEEFRQPTAPLPGREVYNVAGASPLMLWVAYYGPLAEASPPRSVFLGRPRWFTTQADYIFEDPPETVSSPAPGTFKLVISGYGERPLEEKLAPFTDPGDRREIIRLHQTYWPDS